MTLDGVSFPSAEHAYQWARTLDPKEQLSVIFKDPPDRSIFRTSGDCKKQSGLVTTREDWDDIKLAWMTKVVRAKFTQNPDLREKLLSTSPSYLEEGNTWHDKFWGICRCESCGNQGHNYLGIILMNIRGGLI